MNRRGLIALATLVAGAAALFFTRRPNMTDPDDQHHPPPTPSPTPSPTPAPREVEGN